jgi:hypothetical protein
MKTDQEIKEYIAARPGITADRVCSNIKQPGLTRGYVARLMSGASPAASPQQQPPAKVAVRVKPKTLADFRKAHDNPQKIRNGLASLGEGSYLTEEEFRQFCNIPANLWRRNAELPEFADNKLRHAGIVHWASKSTIQDMKTITGSA